MEGNFRIFSFILLIFCIFFASNVSSQDVISSHSKRAVSSYYQLNTSADLTKLQSNIQSDQSDFIYINVSSGDYKGFTMTLTDKSKNTVLTGSSTNLNFKFQKSNMRTRDGFITVDSYVSFNSSLDIMGYLSVVVFNSTFQNNTQNSAIDVLGLTNWFSSLTLNQTTFINNSPQLVCVLFSPSDAIYYHNVFLEQTKFISNSNPDRYPSSLYIEQAQISSNNNTFNGNTGASATYWLLNSLLFSFGDKYLNNNASKESAGAIQAQGSGIRFTSANIESNQGTLSGAVDMGNGVLNMEDSFVFNNTGHYGGGFARLNDSLFDSYQTIYKDNVCKGPFNGVGDGGAIYMFSSNFTSFRDRFENNRASSGGALFLHFVNYVDILQASFVNNSADIAGGAIKVGIPLYSLPNNKLDAVTTFKCDIYSSNFTSNSAGSGGAIEGGGSSIVGLDIQSCRFANNRAFGGSGGSVNMLSSLFFLFIKFSSFDSSFATSNGGAINMEGNTFSSFMNNVTNCTANNNGGGVHLVVPSTTVPSAPTVDTSFYKCHFRGNSALIGGGLLVSGYDNAILRTFTFEGSSFVNNHANLIGGGLCFAASVQQSKFEGCQFIGNRAKFQGGGLITLPSSIIDTVIMNNCEISRNYAVQYGGIGIVSSVNSINITGCSFNSNDATQTGGLHILPQQGEHTTLSMRDSSFTQNSAKESGGGFSLEGSFYEVDVRNSFWDSNIASEGGGVFLQHGSVVSTIFSNSNSNNNTASLRGGFISFQTEGGIVKIQNISSDSDSSGDGGSIYVSGTYSTLNMSTCSFTNCKASNSGGAIAFSAPSSTKRQQTDNTAVTFLEDSTLSNNAADKFGGGIAVLGGSPTASRNSFESNSSPNGKSVAVLDGILYSNSNTMEPQGVYLSPSGNIVTDDPNFVQCPPKYSTSVIENGRVVCVPVPEVPSTANNIVDQEKSNPRDVGIIVGVLLAVIFIVVVIAIIFFVRYRRMKQTQETEMGAISQMERLMLADVKVGTSIGEGFFGKVYVGVWNGLDVALKAVGEGEDSGRSFKEEVLLMNKMNHPNVLRLLGLYRIESMTYMVLEFMENGALNTYLFNDPDRLDDNNLAKMVYDLTNGMLYLSSKGVIHRDLAARNLLLDGSLQVKIADFGMSRQENIYNAKTKTIPYKWCAPETISQGISTTQSDVWSFGICVWEIYSLGQVPYGNMSNEETVSKLKGGYRLPKPYRCPAGLFEIVLKCWNEKPEERPTFADIHAFLLAHFTFLKKELDLSPASGLSDGVYIEPKMEGSHYA
eukprot:TRINITY_DN4981_c0_g1_i1.p1 TRINITY_DN4981_c0_g1~~TRINITY_DN4981_c0_g1_i1.p1  ORF type:complete len:1284 (+),score=378.10 TRINITY_DN4981_c0_g1_i1:76-3927(+)